MTPLHGLDHLPVFVPHCLPPPLDLRRPVVLLPISAQPAKREIALFALLDVLLLSYLGVAEIALVGVDAYFHALQIVLAETGLLGVGRVAFPDVNQHLQ